LSKIGFAAPSRGFGFSPERAYFGPESGQMKGPKSAVPVRRCLAGAEPWTAERLPAGFLVGTLVFYRKCKAFFTGHTSFALFFDNGKSKAHMSS